MKVEIKSTELKQISGTSKKTGRPYSFSLQRAWIHSDAWAYPKEVEVITEDGNPYPVGVYLVDLNKSLQVRNERLQFSLVLAAAPSSASRAA